MAQRSPLPAAGASDVAAGPESDRAEGGEALTECAWYAAWTHSHCERLVHDQLVEKGFDALLPEVSVWGGRGRGRRVFRVPLFPGYVLLHDAMDKRSYLEAIKVRGLVRILGERWDRLAKIPDHEIDAIRKVVDNQMAARPYPHLREGQRVRIVRGPLAGVEGIFVKEKGETGLLVLSIEMFGRSIAVEIDCALARAA